MKILVGLSGGVDSACVALKLMRQGHIVEGAVLKMHDYTDVLSARTVAQELGIPIHEIDMTDAFEKTVKRNFVDEYLNARTPNPCILCNEKVKFAGLYDFAVSNGFDKIATGHYAMVEKTDAGYAVAAASDNKKDQSYMLYRLPQHILSALMLPLGDEKKEDVRKAMAEDGSSVAEKKDSQEICFVPDGKYAEFIQSRGGTVPEGDFVDTEGNVLGKHKGIIHYTVGQRKGLGISLGKRAFVTDISPETNRITLSPEMKGKKRVVLTDVVFSGMKRPKRTERHSFYVKLRYTAPLVHTVAEVNPDGNVTLFFESEVVSAPGQSAVLYDNGRVMLGGYIC